MWWNEATTLASGPEDLLRLLGRGALRRRVNSRPPPKVSGTTVLTTILPRQASRTSGSVAASPLAGTVSTTISAAVTASRLDMPLTRAPGARAASSAALPRARSGSREPINTS